VIVRVPNKISLYFLFIPRTTSEWVPQTCTQLQNLDDVIAGGAEVAIRALKNNIKLRGRCSNESYVDTCQAVS
jgi:hypothetical protein